MQDFRIGKGLQGPARLWIIGLAVVVVVILLLFLGRGGEETRPEPPVVPETMPLPVPPPTETVGTPPPVVSAPREAEPPVTETLGPEEPGTNPAVLPPPPALSLPDLDASDEALRQALAEAQVDSGVRLERLLVSKDLIRRFVVMGENIEATKLPRRHLPVRPPRGRFRVVRGSDGHLHIDPANARRYMPYVDALETLDPEALAGVIERFSPLIAEAWQSLGYRRVDVRARVVAAIDTLLEAPDVPDGAIVVRFSVNYRFADPALEALPESQRLLIRIGHDNALRVKHWLRRLRSVLTKPATVKVSR